MGRIIKFRAWHTPEHKMYHWGSGVIAIDHQGNVETVPAGRLLKHGDVKLMQFTGLLDKNGREIYEGDIIHITWAFEEFRARVFWGGRSAHLTVGTLLRRGYSTL